MSGIEASKCFQILKCLRCWVFIEFGNCIEVVSTNLLKSLLNLFNISLFYFIYNKVLRKLFWFNFMHSCQFSWSIFIMKFSSERQEIKVLLRQIWLAFQMCFFTLRNYKYHEYNVWNLHRNKNPIKNKMDELLFQKASTSTRCCPIRNWWTRTSLKKVHL